MKNILLSTLILLTLALPCSARMNVGIVGGGVSAAAPATLYCTSDTSDGTNTYLRCEDFEGTTDCFPDGATSNHCWKAFDDYSGTPTLNSTTPIEGTYDLLANNDGNNITYMFYSATSPVYLFTKVKLGATSANTDILSILTSGGTSLLTVKSYADSSLQIYCGEYGTATATNSFVASQIYNLWVDYTAETGDANSDGIAHVYLSTTDTKGSAVITKTNCSANGTPARVYFWGFNGEIDVWFDRIRVKASDMTGVP